MAERGAPRRAVAGDHHVPEPARHRRARPVRRPAVDLGEGHALAQLGVEPDGSDDDPPDRLVRVVGVRVGR